MNTEAYLCGCNVHIRKNCEWVEYIPDNPDRNIVNTNRDREYVRCAVELLTAALKSG
jgi:hypothetical protein